MPASKAYSFQSDDEDYSPEPSSAKSSRSQNTSYSQLSDFSRRPSHSQTLPLSQSINPGMDATPLVHASQNTSVPRDSDYDTEYLFETAAQVSGGKDTSYLGQICEVHWLRGLKTRLQGYNSPQPRLSETNFHLDDDGIQLLHQDNPFHMPPENLATVLAQCYFQTVHAVFPLISSDVEDQLQIYYTSMLKGHDVQYSQRWYAIINLILAIGARFSRLINAEWYTNPLDESLYISRACQLLGINDTAVMLVNSDLSLIQVSLDINSPLTY
jgi:hypothetical protein